MTFSLQIFLKYFRPFIYIKGIELYYHFTNFVFKVQIPIFDLLKSKLVVANTFIKK